MPRGAAQHAVRAGRGGQRARGAGGGGGGGRRAAAGAAARGTRRAARAPRRRLPAAGHRQALRGRKASSSRTATLDTYHGQGYLEIIPLRIGDGEPLFQIANLTMLMGPACPSSCANRTV